MERGTGSLSLMADSTPRHSRALQRRSANLERSPAASTELPQKLNAKVREYYKAPAFAEGDWLQRLDLSASAETMDHES